ncbi:MAG: 3-oxoacyl-ACP reductase FabG [Lachnospiraceae bacterium]|nr:3-oxoacyl-ACP reductase FabG [Lachnospiraceae bacterium]
MKRKTVLVTGSARGIGRAIALAFAKNGYDVIVNCVRSIEALSDLEEEILACGVRSRSFIGNVGDASFVRRMFETIAKESGTLDVLVNNAGISYVGLLTDMTAEDWQTILDTNLSSVFYCSSQAIPLMLKEHKGRIINISSMWGTSGASCEVAYSATKGGMNAFTKALAKELAPSGITVNAIACGVIDTEMNHCFSEEELAALAEEIPAGRFGTAEEVAKLALQLAEGPDYLTGQIIGLDGGYL